MRSKRIIAALLAACLLALAACAQEPPEAEDKPYSISVSVGESQDTLDPARADASGCETVLYHLYENLLRWEDGGTGWAEAVPGQAESWTAETDYAGNTTYTFRLRQSACWSDGEQVTASDFVTAWRRLADPAEASPHRELLSAVAGYEDVQKTGDVEKLSVSAPDDETFVVTLNGSPAWFLPELCAGAYTMPVREELLPEWGGPGAVSNGAYRLAELTAEQVRLERSGTYYDLSETGPDELRFITSRGGEEDYSQLLGGALDLAADLPESVLQERDESWIPEPVTEVHGVLMNLSAPPFDEPDIRQAFALAIDRTAVAAGLGSRTVRAAEGLVPCGIADYGSQPPEAEEGPFWDFRAHSLERVTVPETGDYEENCRLARRLMTEAGYPDGDGFRKVEYVYVDTPEGDAMAKALRRMWQEQLGVSVTLRAMSREDYDALLYPPPAEAPAESGSEESSGSGETPEAEEDVFQLAEWDFRAPYNDAAAVLECWRGGENPAGYADEGFDLIMQAAGTAVDAAARDALLHDAEALLMEDVPVAPVYCSGGSFQLAEQWTGLYRKPNGVYFLGRITAA